MGLFICTPEVYYSKDECVKRKTNRQSNSWIFDIINNNYTKEPWIHCMYQEEDWTLICHHSFKKILIVFKDCTLQSLRDLRQKHVKLLLHIRKKVTALLKADPVKYGIHSIDLQKNNKIEFYFHYWPTVFQLHAHVSINDNRQKLCCRCHDFKHIIRNLMISDTYYECAIIHAQLGRQNVVEK